MFHGGKLLHQRSVLIEFFLGAQDELVHHLAVVEVHEPDRFALFDLNEIGCEAHVVGHADLHGSLDGVRVTADAPFLLFHFHGRGSFGVLFVAMGK
ncbi:hypothetical protein D9M68_1001690 [compost metagenome]